MHDDDSTPLSPVPEDLTDRPLGVLVGFDGSPESVLALHYAARAALRLGTRLTVVTAYTVPRFSHAEVGLIPDVPYEELFRGGAAELGAEARRHLEGYPGEHELRIERGDAAGVLVALSAQAQLAVVGARGRGGFVGRLLGSVSSALPAHAQCPTVVVPRQYEIGTGEGAERFAVVEDDAPVVVGVDTSANSRDAAMVAARAARDRRAPLRVLMLVPPPEQWGGAYMGSLPDFLTLETHRTKLATALERDTEELRERFPDVPITTEVKIADPAQQLVKASRSAQLVVVGTRGRGRMASTLLGSVSRALLQRAEGPVLVVPDSSRRGAAPRRPR